MKNICSASSAALMVVLLTSCAGITPAARIDPQSTVEVTRLAASATPVATHTAMPTDIPVTPAPLMGTPIPGPDDIIPPYPGQQVYSDPQGWYLVNFPEAMKPTDKPNAFRSAQGDSFETGFLPELGSMPKIVNVCTWLANVVYDPKQSAIELGDGAPCAITNRRGAARGTRVVIYENQGADPEHRYVYVRTGSHSAKYYINVAFSWLKRTAGAELEAGSPAASSTEAAFWETAIPLPPGISVRESKVPGVDPTRQDGLSGWPARKTETPTPEPTTIQALGYELRAAKASKGSPALSQLYRNGRLLLDRVLNIRKVYSFPTASGSINAFIVRVDTGKEWKDVLVQNGVITTSWSESGMDPELAPILYKGGLLWAKVTQDAHVEIKKSNGEVLFTFATYVYASLPRINFRTWNGHWILEVDNFVIQDGEILNTKLGFQQIFNWSLIQDKPAYFFRKGASVGFSYDGQILPLRYQDVAHGMCCSPAQNNPSIRDDFAYFYGMRDGEWYYVALKFK